MKLDFLVNKNWKKDLCLILIIFLIPAIIATIKYGLNGALGSVVFIIGSCAVIIWEPFSAKVVWRGTWGRLLGWAIVFILWLVFLIFLFSS